MNYIETSINKWNEIDKEEKLCLYSLSRINNIINYLLISLEKNTKEKKDLVKGFAEVELQIMLIGFIYESIRFYKEHALLLDPKRFTSRVNERLEKIKLLVKEYSNASSYINQIIKPIRDKYVFHFDNELNLQIDSYISKLDKIVFMLSTNGSSKESYYNFPVHMFMNIVQQAYDGGYISENDFNELRSKNMLIAVDIIKINENIMSSITKGKVVKERKKI